MRRIVFSIVFSQYWSQALLSFQIYEIETEFLHADWTSEFSRGQDPQATVARSAAGQVGKEDKLLSWAPRALGHKNKASLRGDLPYPGRSVGNWANKCCARTESTAGRRVRWLKLINPLRSF